MATGGNLIRPPPLPPATALFGLISLSLSLFPCVCVGYCIEGSLDGAGMKRGSIVACHCTGSSYYTVAARAPFLSFPFYPSSERTILLPLAFVIRCCCCFYVVLCYIMCSLLYSLCLSLSLCVCVCTVQYDPIKSYAMHSTRWID